MADNTVKVTLTADDQATEVVRRLAAAVKQLDAQQRTSNQSVGGAKQAAQGAASAFSLFQKAIAGVAVALGAVRVVEFVRDTIRATDEIGKLALKTGASTEALSVLAVAASTADLSQEQLGTGLKFLARSFTELQQGVPATVEAFAAIGLSASELKGLSLDQVIVKISNAQDKFADGAGKTAALLKIFGRSGEELIPLLHDLANGGFAEAEAKAKSLGLILSHETTRAAQDFDDALTTLKNSVKGLVIELTPLIKGLADVATAVASFVSRHGDLITFSFAALGVAAAIYEIVKAVKALRAAIAAGGIASLFTPQGLAIAGFAILAGLIALVVKKFIEARAAKKALEEPLATDPTLDKFLGIDKKPDVDLQDAGQRKALIEAQLAATRQGLKDELAATQEGLNLVSEIEAERFQQGLSSLREFYAQRVQITKQGVAARRAELEAEKQELAASPLPENTPAERVKRATELRGIEAQIARVKVDGQTQVLSLLEEERQKRLQIADAVRSFEVQILKAQGNSAAAAQLEITAAVNQFTLALQAQRGAIDESAQAEITQFRTLLTAQANFAQAQARATQEQNSLDLARQAIRERVAQGLESERQGQVDIAAIEAQRLPTLKNLADQMDKFAAETNNSELKQAAEQFRASFASIGVVVNESTIKLANLRDTLLGAAQNELSQFLGDTISHVHSLSEAFTALGQGIVSSFQRVLGDIIATQAIDAIRGLFEGGAKVGAEVTAAGAETAAATATVGAATALGLASATMLSGSVALDGSSVALGASGGILLAAAAALSAAASALAIAGIFTVPGLATGGFVRGPGTSTSDSILARLSAGEFVVRASAVQRLGVPFLESLNGARTTQLRSFSAVPAFASGGLVTAGGSDASGSLEATIGLRDGLVLEHLDTKGGLKTLLKIVGRNPGAFKASLGVG